MTLDTASIEWAIEFLSAHSDGDLFPRLPELEAVVEKKDEFSSLIEGKDLTQFSTGAARRFLVPKDEFSYRQATQLDPQDSILLTAAVHQFGNGIEQRRLPRDIVFSYRFQPDPIAGLYSGESAWNKFWTKAHSLSRSCGAILYCDIADFYNQIYHHTVENQLIEAGFPNQAKKWIIELLKSTTAGVSRGVPVGPHAIHLIAEATLIPVDRSLQSLGLTFLRFADDILIFCADNTQAKSAVGKLALILDKQQRLTLQRHKTCVYAPASFQAHCAAMIEDRPISADEEALVKLIRKYSSGNPYQAVRYSQITADDWNQISETAIRAIITDYLSKDPVDYIRLRWFYRRLCQVGHPGALSVSLENIERLGPCFANLCQYFASIQAIDDNEWRSIGGHLLGLLNREEVRENEYFGLSVLSLFSKKPSLNHISTLLGQFSSAPAYARREILFAAKASGSFDWVREHKESFLMMDPWQQRAMLFAFSGMARDEKKYFVDYCRLERPFDLILGKWCKTI